MAKKSRQFSTSDFTPEQVANIPALKKAYEEALAEETRLAAEKKAAAAERRKELKAVRDAEKKSKVAQQKAAQSAQKAADQANTRLTKLKEKIVTSEQNKAPPSNIPAPSPSVPVNQPASGGFFSDALESSVESEYNQKDAGQGRRALGRIAKSAFKNLVARPALGVAAAAGGLLSTEYMGLAAPTALAGLGVQKLASGIGGMFSGSSKPTRGGSAPTRTLSSLFGTGSSSKDTANVNILKRISDNTENANERLSDIFNSIDRLNTSNIEDKREIKQQNDQIIELLQQIAKNKGGSSGDKDNKSWWDKLKDGILGGFGSLLKMASGLLGDVFGLATKLLEGIGGRLLSLLGGLGLALGGKLIRGGITAAKFIGRGITKAAGFVASGVKSLFGMGGKEAAETAADTGIKTAEKTGVEAAEKGTGKAAEKVLAKEGGEAAVKEGAKVAGKGGLKAIVAKVIGPRVAKVVAKSVPFVGALAGLGFGIARAMEGDWKGAAAEVAGGTASLFPGVGTAASVATDVGLLARDVYKSAYGVFPEDDPLAGERLEEVKKEVMDYIGSNVSGSTPQDASKVNPSAPTASDNAGNNSVSPSSSPSNSGAPNAISPTLNPEVSFNQGSAQMALSGSAPPAPIIVNNNNINNSSGGGGGKGSAPTRSSGRPSTSPEQSHIDRALYGDLYGAGVP